LPSTQSIQFKWTFQGLLGKYKNISVAAFNVGTHHGETVI
jgi:hypothetical protein